MKLVKKLAFLAAIPLGLVLVIELVLWFAFPVEMEPTTRVILRNDIPEFADTEVTYQISPQGLRGYQWSKEPSPDALRILVVGVNSTTHLLQNAENTWWGRLARMLEEKSGKRVEAAAVASIGDTGILSGVVWAERILAETKADLLLVCYGFGDVMKPPYDYVFDPERLSKLKVEPERGFKYKLAEISQICRRIRRGRVASARRSQLASWSQENQYLAMLQAGMIHYQQQPSVAGVSRSSDPLEEYLLGVRKFIDLAERKGLGLLVIGEPALHHEFLGRDSLDASDLQQDGRRRLLTTVRPGPGPEDEGRADFAWVQGELDRYYANAALVCKEEGVAFVSLNGKVPRNPEYFLTEVLFTDTGARKAAEILLPALEPLIP
jgi:lysophospholipase L1-like esterase